MLQRLDPAGGEALAVAHALDVVDDRDLRVAGKQEVGVHGMRRPVGDVDGAAGSNQRLADDLAAEYALPADLRAAAAEQVHLELFEVEDAEQVFDRGGHGGAPVPGHPIGCPGFEAPDNSYMY